MKIGIDARTILNPEKGDAIGVGHYTYQLIRHLLDVDKENEYVLFFDFRVREKDVKKFTRPNVTIKFFPFSDYKKYLPGVYNEILGTATLQKENLDILHSTSPTSRIPAGYTGKTIVTFHNLAPFSMPETFSPVKRTRERAQSRAMAGKADRIIAASESVRRELKSHLSANDSKIDVIYSGLDSRFFDDPEDGADKILNKYEIGKKYILFLGTLEPSKNIARLLEAFAAFKKACKDKNKKFDYQLVLAGKNGWRSDEYAMLVNDLGLSKDIVFTGYIIGDELVPLFKGAEFFVMPSLYEGFGMTLLEAFATKTPAIVSEVGSLPEIAQSSAYFIDPRNTAAITDSLIKFSEDQALREEYATKGFQQAKKFDWDKTALETLEVYKKLASDNK